MKTLIAIALLLSGVATGLSTIAFVKINKLLSLEKPSIVQKAEAPAILCEDNNNAETCRVP